MLLNHVCLRRIRDPCKRKKMRFDNNNTALVMCTYNWPEALELIFKSILKQTVLPGEIVIADDGSTESTKKLIEKYQSLFSVPLRHVWHPDTGYTKTIIMNKAIGTIEKDYIIQIDGDVILHPNFIEDHLSFCKPGCWVRGSRVFLEAKISKVIQKSGRIKFNLFSGGIEKNRFNTLHFPLLRDIFFSKSVLDSDARGCNMAYWKADFVKVNGYNQDITGYGAEDSELASRLTNNGIKKRKIKLGAVQYHIYHKAFSRARRDANTCIQQEITQSGQRYCLNGLELLLPEGEEC